MAYIKSFLGIGFCGGEVLQWEFHTVVFKRQLFLNQVELPPFPQSALCSIALSICSECMHGFSLVQPLNVSVCVLSIV